MGPLDRDRGQTLSSLRGCAAKLRLTRTERPEGLPELARAAATCIHPRPQRRLEAKGALRAGVQQGSGLFCALRELDQARAASAVRGLRLRLRSREEPKLNAAEHRDGVEPGRLGEVEADAAFGRI